MAFYLRKIISDKKLMESRSMESGKLTNANGLDVVGKRLIEIYQSLLKSLQYRF